MKLAFCLFNYFPYGGLQRDFMRIAKECVARGHEVHVLTMRWEGDTNPDFHLHIISGRGWQNHSRSHSYAKKVKKFLDQHKFDLVIGFNKMPHLDLYYAADVCYVSRMKEERSPWARLLPRYRVWAQLEKAVFEKGQKTKIMLISAKQQAEYTEHYQTEENRFVLLPPGIERNRLAPPNAAEIKQKIRAAHQVASDKIILLMVGSGFKTKGVDRSLRALASMSPADQARCQLWVIGKDEPAEFKKLAASLNVAHMVNFLGARDDVPDYLLAADLLLQPSYHENTGTVILEAMASRLPVLTVEACGYAFYVEQAKAGRVLPAPFRQQAWNHALIEMINAPDLADYGKRGFEFASSADIFSMPQRAADVIEQAGK